MFSTSLRPGSAGVDLVPVGRRERLWVILLLCAGLAGRLGWLLLRRTLDAAPAEAGNVAAAYARGFGIADAFGRGSGLTAHLNPLLPAFAGTLYHWLGLRSPAAELILLAVALALAFGSALLFNDAFRRLGVGPRPRLAALALFCFLPINLNLETVMFRVWDGALATALLAFGFRQVVVLDARPAATWRDIAGYALLAAFALFVSPAVGAALYAAAALFVLRRLRGRRALATVGVAAAALALVLAPWAIRNELAFGRFIPLRSNAGLELAIANHAGVEGGGSDRDVFLRRFYRIHPSVSQAAFERMQRMGGEAAYADALGREARAWMAAHPWAAARLAAKHLWQFYFPPAWQFDVLTSGGRATGLKVALVQIVAALGLVGALAWAVLARGPWLYAAIVLLAPAAPYVLVQPNFRYHYLVSTLLMFHAAALFALPRRGRGGGR